MRKIFTLLALFLLAQQFATAQVVTTTTINLKERAEYEASHPDLFKPCSTCPIREADAGWEEVSLHNPTVEGPSVRMSQPLPKQNGPRPDVPSRLPIQNWLAHIDPNTVIPPDTYGAVGLSQVMTTTNNFVQVHNKANGALLIPAVSISGFTGIGNTCDPQVFFDPSTSRWYFVAIECTSNGNRVILMVSNTSDATGTWVTRTWVPNSVNGSILLDHPYLGYDDTKIVIGGRKFPAGFSGPILFLFDKAAMLAGTPINFGVNAQTIESSAADGDSPRPVTVYFPPYSTTGNPSPGTVYIVQGWNSTQIRLTTVTGNIPSCVWNLGSAIFPTAPAAEGWTTGSQGNPGSVPQKPPVNPTTERLQANDDRISSAVMMNGNIWCSQHCAFPQGATGASVDHTDVQLWKLNGTPGGTFGQVIQRARTNAASGQHRWFSSVAVNKNEDVVVGYSISDLTTLWASAGYSTRQIFTPLNTLDDPYVYHAGEGPYYKAGGGRARWGDYSQTHLDPVDNSLWTIQEYASTPVGTYNAGGSRYGMWWAQIPATVPSATPVIVSAGPPTLNAESCVPNNGNVDPGETVTMTFCLQNVGTGPTTNAVVTMQSSGGVVPITGPQNYGVIVNGGAPVCGTFQFTNTSSTCGGTITVTLQVQDGAANLGNITYTITLGQQVVTPFTNGGFETGSLAPWTAVATTPAPVVNTVSPRTGTYALFLGNTSGFEPFGDASVYQQFTVPPSGGTLSFWYKGYTEDGITFDWQDAYITNTSNTILATIMHVCNTGPYTQVTYNLTPFAGQTVRLMFLVHQDGFGDVTNMYVDDVTITTYNCCGPPCVLTCPPNITANSSPGVCGTNVNYAAPSASGLCGPITGNPASGSFFPVGTTTVTCTSASGATCTFTVTVIDNQPPSFNYAPFPDRLYYKWDGSGTSVPNLASAPPAGTGTATITGNLTQGSTGKCGTALVGTGASVLTNFMNTGWNPNMSTPWTIGFWVGPAQIDMNPSYLFGALSAGSFRCFYGGAAGTNSLLLRGGSGDVLISGINPAATYVTIVYNGTNTVVYKNGGSPTTYNVTFSNVGATPLYLGAYNTTAGVAGMNGRMDEFCMFSRALSAGEVLSLFNACPPANPASCPSNITVNNDPGQCSAVVNYPTPTAFDNCPGTVTVVRTLGLASGSAFPVGTTVVRFVATDAAGNQGICQFNVTVVDAQPPTLTCPASITQNTDLGQCYATVNTPNPVFGDNCGVSKLTWTITGATTASSPATGINYVGTRQFGLTGTTGQGISTVTYTATDPSGNTTTCSYTVTVNDAWLPVISVQPATKFVCFGSNGTFSVTATAGGGPIAYQWQEWNGSAWVNIAGATTNQFTVPSVTFADNTRSFRVILTGTCSVVTSTFATLYINPLPTISLTTSIPPLLLPGQSMDITAVASPTGGNYAWYLGSSLVQNGPSEVYSGVTVDQLGTYKVTYTDLNGCVSTSANLVVSGQPSGKLWVYPNPNMGSFQVRFYNQPNEAATVRVFDSKGAKIYEKVAAGLINAYGQIQVDLPPTTQAGVYVVELVNGGGKRVDGVKIIVRHHP